MKSLITTSFLAATLALSGNAANAAYLITPTMAKEYGLHKRTEPVARHGHHPTIAQRGYYPGGYYPGGGALGYDIGAFIQAMMSGGPVPYQYLARDVARTRGAHKVGGAYDYSPPVSVTAPDTPVDNSAEQNSEQASEEANEISLQNSMEMTQQQNDEANADFNAGIAAAEQTEIQANQ